MSKSIIILSIIFSFDSFSKVDWKEVYNKDDIIVYADQNAKGIIPFKAIGHINSDISSVLKVLIDQKRKPEWAPKLKSVKIHKKYSEENMIFSEYYETPWPATDREFLLHGKVIKQKGYYYLKAETIYENKYMDKNHIQADVKKLELILEKISLEKTKITFEFYGDMKGWMPTWLINLIQKRWPYKFIKNLREQILSDR